MKTYSRFVNEMYSPKGIRVYHGFGREIYVYEGDELTMEYIFVVDGNDEVKGFCTVGFQTEEMEREGVKSIGTIVGPQMGKYLYDGFMSYFGRICPTSNESDLAKKSWKKKFDDPAYTKEKIKGIGFYDRYPEEDFLNTVFNVKKKIGVEELSYFDNLNIYKQVEKMYRDCDKNLKWDKYLVGQSRTRDEHLIDIGEDPKKVNYIKNNPVQQ